MLVRIFSVCLSDSALLGRSKSRVFIPIGLAYEDRCMTQEAALLLHNNDIMGSRNRFLKHRNGWNIGFLRIGTIGPSRISTIVWQTTSGYRSNYMR